MATYNSYYQPHLSVRIELSKGFSQPLPGPPPTSTSRTNLLDSPFPFLSLPRELRDLVYSHTFHDRGIHYRDRIHATMPWSQRRTLASHLNLLLTCRQIRTEALSALFRTRTVEISFRRLHRTRRHLNPLSLSHVLCSFPLAAACLIRRIQIVYCEYSLYYPEDRCLMFTTWEHIVRDAWTLKAHFPHLNRFEARSRLLEERMGSEFFAKQDYCHTLGESERHQREEQVAAEVASWLDSELGEMELVPPRWLKIIFSDELEASDSDLKSLRFQHEVLEQAHLLLAKKRKVIHEEREASGRMWLEACSMKRKGGRTGWWEGIDTA